jgi:hypothetical protein
LIKDHPNDCNIEVVLPRVSDSIVGTIWQQAFGGVQYRIALSNVALQESQLIYTAG